ncbi:ATP-dependent RNA helicase [Gammaproteobacteria bacterium]|nr:ATP-dependent RNA helicase [Gammaproteobacteria bacterium]
MDTTHLFSSLNIPKEQLDNLDILGYLAMTPIQSLALPPILAKKDVRAKAKTGSGKTAAFGIGILTFIDVNLFQVQSLILCPTRELATQVTQELRRLARYLPNVKITSLCGGVSKRPQDVSLMRPAHIVVGTPGRILDHLSKRTLSLEFLKTFVLDEADRMLDMGFSDTVDEIIDLLPTARQTLLFSATYPPQIEKMSAHVQNNPISVSIDSQNDILKIEQLFFKVSRENRLETLEKILGHYQPQSCLIFCNTKRETSIVMDALSAQGMSVLALNGDLEQRERDQVLVQFSNGSCRILVATDVAARGLDIKALALVINYEMAFDADTHIHRIGRTGRAGLEGLAISLCHEKELHRVKSIEQDLNISALFIDINSLYEKKSDPKLAHLESKMLTLRIDAGRKAKIRAGDILGALTGDSGLLSEDIGKIDLFDMYSCVAITQAIADRHFIRTQEIKIKGRYVRVRLLE